MWEAHHHALRSNLLREDRRRMIRTTAGVELVHGMVAFVVRLPPLLLVEAQAPTRETTAMVQPTMGTGRIRLRAHPRPLISRVLPGSDLCRLIFKTCGTTALIRTARFVDL